MKKLIDLEINSQIETCQRNLKKSICEETIKILKKRIELLRFKKGRGKYAKK